MESEHDDPTAKTSRSNETYGDIWIRNKRLLMIVLTPVCLIFGVDSLIESVSILNRDQYPLATGTIVGEETTTVLGFVKRPYLSIRVKDSGEIVHAILSMDVRKDFRNPVRFHYSGDPAKEVYLEGETNPIWAALLCLLGPLVVFKLLRRKERFSTPSDQPDTDNLPMG